MFKKGDYVVYGHTGICEVLDVTTMDVEGISKDRLYYVLRPESEKEGRIFTPADSTRLVIRRILSREEAEDLITVIPEIKTIDIAEDKRREEKYKECIRTCECTDLIRIIKTIYLRKKDRLSQGKKVTATDERYLKMAEDNLYAELSKLLGIPKGQMAAYITTRMKTPQSA